MQVYRQLTEVPPAVRALAIGAFDGLHLGHQAVIGRALSWSEANDAPACVVTFEPHPARVLYPERAPALLTPLDIKLDAIAALGPQETLVIPFDRELAARTAEQFCEEVLKDVLGAADVAVGANFHFGHHARGNAAFLIERGSEFGFTADVAEVVEIDGEPVSSSRIRKLITAGEVERASLLLGRPFEFCGTVVKGSRRGHDLGFPTANLEPEPGLIVPGFGIYAAIADGVPAAVSIGTRPTFEEHGHPLIEAYLLDDTESGEERDLYDRRLGIKFLRRLRDELKFDSAQQLIEQMERDIEEVRGVVGGMS